MLTSDLPVLLCQLKMMGFCWCHPSLPVIIIIIIIIIIIAVRFFVVIIITLIIINNIILLKIGISDWLTHRWFFLSLVINGLRGESSLSLSMSGVVKSDWGNFFTTLTNQSPLSGPGLALVQRWRILWSSPAVWRFFINNIIWIFWLLTNNTI